MRRQEWKGSEVIGSRISKNLNLVFTEHLIDKYNNFVMRKIIVIQSRKALYQISYITALSLLSVWLYIKCCELVTMTLYLATMTL